ncbi:uncharacterized protein LOC144546467 isoform X2 [Carex rostrata]
MNNMLNSTGSYSSSYMPLLDLSMHRNEEISAEVVDHNTQQLQLCSYNSSSNLNSSSFNYHPNQQFLDLSYPPITSNNNQLVLAQNYASQHPIHQPLFPDNDYSNQLGLGLDIGNRMLYPSRESSWALTQYFQSSGRYYGFGNQLPRCQAEGCKADLTKTKKYHRRHKVCEFHSKAALVHLGGGNMQRFCQQCSRFHILDEFDDTKKSCRRRLADHNRRRRKPKPNSSTPSSSATPINTTPAEKQEHCTALHLTNTENARTEEVQHDQNSKTEDINTGFQANLNQETGRVQAFTVAYQNMKL